VKILYHHRTQAEDGQAVHIRSLQRAFESLGHEVTEYSLVSQGASERGGGGRDLEQERSRWDWVGRVPRFVREGLEYGYSLPAWRGLKGALRRCDPDLIYERYAFGNAAGVWASRGHRAPLFLEVNSPMVLELSRTRGLSFPRFAARTEARILRGADRVLAVTGVLGDMLCELGVERERLMITPNGVDLELYAEPGDTAARAAARRGLGVEASIPADAMTLGFVGYYRTWHRLDLAVAALAEPQLLEAHLVLIGEGPAEEEIRAAARAAGVAERVHFAGRRAHAEVPRLLPAFDLALIPAINPYASPLKLHEYMAAGLATVAPDQPNLREVLQHGRDALLFPKDDGEAFAATLVELAADPERTRALGRAARQSVIDQELTWVGNARRVVREVERLGR
jgi:glycosyltransferase involved in cell wall biosynthesis